MADAMGWFDVAQAAAGQIGWTVSALVVGAAFWWLRTPIAEQLIPKMSGIKAGGVELTFAQEAMAKAAHDAELHNVVIRSTVAKPVDITERDKERALMRAKRCRDLLAGKRILWVDDLITNNRLERKMLEAFGLGIEQASTNGEATAALLPDKGGYDLILSDIERPDSRTGGLELLGWLRAQRARVPLVFYITNLNADRPTPLGAFGITNRPDTLLHLVIDALERTA